jgi:ABC-2 type transport system permease protein
MKGILTVARRELKAMFDSPTGYVLLIVFLVINGFLFFSRAYLSNSASLRPMMDMLPWLLLFFVPAVAMRTLAEDTRGGNLEVVLSQPINELELLLGKYLGAVLFLWFALVLTLVIPVTLTRGLPPGVSMAWSVVVAQYAGAMLLVVGLAGVGVWASGITRSQITAFIVAVAIMFVLVLVGLDQLLVGLSPQLAIIAARLGVLSHFDSIGRGVIDLRDVVYFLSLAAIFLTMAYGALMARKLAAGQAPVKRLRVGVLLLVVTLVVVNLLGSYISGRLDLTPGKAYTLSPATKKLVGSLSDIVTIKVYASKDLPSEVGLMKRDLDDMLGDLRSAGNGKIRLQERNPDTDEATKKEAANLGITPVQFNIRGQASLEVKEGYLGMVIQYADLTEPIPFVRRTDDLEYRIASSIRGMTRSGKRKVGLIVAMDDWGREGRSLSQVQEQLAKSYEVVPVSLDDPSTLSDSTLVAVMIAGQPQMLSQPAHDALAAFLARGGGALIMTSGAPIDGRTPRAVGKEPVWNSILSPFGVKVRPDLVYDLSSNQMVPVPNAGGGGSVYQPYPFWVRGVAGDGVSVVTDGVNELFLPWVSSIDFSGAKAGTVTPLIASSRAAGVAEGDIDLNPTRAFPRSNVRQHILGVQVQADSASPVRGRVVLVGNAEFATDRYLSPDNGAFALNAVDWLAQDEALISIRSRDRRPPRLLFTSPVMQEAIKYVNLVGVPLLIAVWGVVRLVRRRRRSLTPWTPLAGGAA